MYEKQTQSKKYRDLDKTLGLYFRSDPQVEQLYKTHFKKQHAGKQTKRYLNLMNQIQKTERLTFRELKDYL